MSRHLLKLLLSGCVLLSGLAQALPTPNNEQLAALKSIEGKKVRICIFDPIGANGPAVGYARDYMLEAKKWGVNADIKAYTDERVAADLMGQTRREFPELLHCPECQTVTPPRTSHRSSPDTQ